jgi:hypothetical protein
VDERPDQIEDHIRSTQRELGSNLQELEDKVKDATNWRVQFERHPMALLGIAFAGGLLLSAGLGGRRHRTPPSYYRSWTPAPHLSGSGLDTPASGPGFERKEKPSDVWGGIKGALLAAAGTQVSNVLGDFLPGFKEHATQTGEAAARSPGPPDSGNGVHDEVRPSNRPML